MKIFDLIKSRRSIRKFKNIPIKLQDLKDLIEAGIYAPTGANTQCYRFAITTNPLDIEHMSINRTKYFKSCKAIILCFADWSVCWNNYPKKSKQFPNLPYWDCGAAIQNILLLATEKGLGTCWISMSPQMKCMEYINKIFNISNTCEIMGAIDYEKDLHQKKPIKRHPLDFYILNWR